MRRILLCVTLTAALAPACSGDAASPACEDPVAATEVSLSDFEFEPVCMEASAGDTLTFINTGEAPHTYTVSDSDVNVNLDSGETGEVVLGNLAPGTYAVRCTFHPQMVGALKIT